MPAERNALASSSASQNSNRGGRGRARGRSNGIGGSGGRRGGRGGRRGGYAPYERPTFSPQESLNLSQTPDPGFATKLDAPGIKALTFEARFDVKE